MSNLPSSSTLRRSGLGCSRLSHPSWKHLLWRRRLPSDGPVSGRCSQGQSHRSVGESDFRVVREGNHISMERENPDGSGTPLTMPNHRRIKGSTWRRICTQAGISREAFLEAYSAEQGGLTCRPFDTSERRGSSSTVTRGPSRPTSTWSRVSLAKFWLEPEYP